MDEYERGLTRPEIEKELGITQYAARDFLLTFGSRVGVQLVISQRRFRHMQLDGTVAQWMSAYSKRKATQDRLFKSKEDV